jgi:hypothetical protein
MRIFKQGMAIFLSWWLVLVGVGVQEGFAFQNDAPTADASTSQEPPQAAQQSPEQLQQLAAPIALYPDQLIAQILSAATYPDEIAEAQKWMTQHKELTGESLAKEVDKQSWDPSVKALTQFPAVLANMSQNLAWTSELGDASVNQSQELSQAIQTMREKAKQAGNLKTTPQEKVSDKGKTIVIEPASPEVVYVPQYDPWLVYGAPLAAFPGWYPYPGLFFAGPGIGFGLGFGVGLFAGFGWGFGHWGFDWHHGGRAVFNHNTFISHSRTIINHNNFHSGFNRGGFNHAGNFHGGGSAGHGGFGGHQGFHGAAGMHSGAFGGFSHGGVARGNSFRGQSSFGGGHAGGGFHGGGGGHGGGGHR